MNEPSSATEPPQISDDQSEAKRVNGKMEAMHGWRRVVNSDPTDQEVLSALGLSEIIYVVTEEIANEYLQYITSGPIGFDTEFIKRKPSIVEERIMNMKTHSAGAKRTAKSVVQYLELFSEQGVQIDWERAGLCTIQICVGGTVWILNMKRIRAFPNELRRILTSPDIALAGVGLLSDVNVVWEDLRVDLQNLVDVGLMAKLWKPEVHADEAFQNLSLEAATSEVFSITIDKGQQKGVLWDQDLKDEDIVYAAIDAIASLRLLETLSVALAEKEKVIGKVIPSSWYTFNATEGEPTRVELSYRGAVIVWSTRDCSWYSGGKFQGYFP